MLQQKQICWPKKKKVMIWDKTRLWASGGELIRSQNVEKYMGRPETNARPYHRIWRWGMGVINCPTFEKKNSSFQTWSPTGEDILSVSRTLTILI